MLAQLLYEQCSFTSLHRVPWNEWHVSMLSPVSCTGPMCCPTGSHVSYCATLTDQCTTTASDWWTTSVVFVCVALPLASKSACASLLQPSGRPCVSRDRHRQCPSRDHQEDTGEFSVSAVYLTCSEAQSDHMHQRVWSSEAWLSKLGCTLNL